MVDHSRIQEITAQIDQEMLDELKSTTNLPAQVQTVMFCVCAVFGQQCSVTNVRTLLKNKFLLKKIQDFTITEINQQEHKAVDKFLYGKEWEPDEAAEKFLVAGILADWIEELHIQHSHKSVFDCKFKKEEDELLGKFKTCKEIKKKMHHKRNPNEEQEIQEKKIRSQIK